MILAIASHIFLTTFTAMENIKTQYDFVRGSDTFTPLKLFIYAT